MGKIAVNLDHRIRLDIEEGRIEIPHPKAFMAGSFSVSGTYDLNFEDHGNGPVLVAESADDEILDDDCVAKFSYKGWGIPVGRERFHHILTPKGYKQVRDRYIKAIEEFKPSFWRGPKDHARYGTPITIADVDAAFAFAWKQYVANSKAKLKRLKDNVKEATNALNKVAKA